MTDRDKTFGARLSRVAIRTCGNESGAWWVCFRDRLDAVGSTLSDGQIMAFLQDRAVPTPTDLDDLAAAVRCDPTWLHTGATDDQRVMALRRALRSSDSGAIAARLRQAIAAPPSSPEAVAEALRAGGDAVDADEVRLWLGGRAMPSLRLLRACAAILNCDPDWILFG